MKFFNFYIKKFFKINVLYFWCNFPKTKKKIINSEMIIFSQANDLKNKNIKLVKWTLKFLYDTKNVNDFFRYKFMFFSFEKVSREA